MKNILKHKIKLASKSPRRKQLLEQAGFDIEVVSIDVDEIYPSDMLAPNVPVYLAELKARAAAEVFPNDFILTADTIVIHKNEILGKPKNLDEAKIMICQMAGNSHTVVSGVCFFFDDHMHSFSATTQVHFCDISLSEIDYYVQNYEVLDKAGAYGIQDWIGWCKVKYIEGSYSNVMGLPVSKVYEELQHFDF